MYLLSKAKTFCLNLSYALPNSIVIMIIIKKKIRQKNKLTAKSEYIEYDSKYDKIIILMILKITVLSIVLLLAQWNFNTTKNVCMYIPQLSRTIYQCIHY